MKMGAKSLIFGVHHILWHPFTVCIAWIELYGVPNWKELVCIFIHDWGYYDCSNMDGPEGVNHPLLAAEIAEKYLDAPNSTRYHDLCLYHSRTTASKYNTTPSKLCWSDKLSCKYDPWWFYIARGMLTGEIKEYRTNAARLGETPIECPHKTWYKQAREKQMKRAYERDATPAYE